MAPIKVMLIGPSGVGKTTFLRKASNAPLVQNDAIELLSSRVGTPRSPFPTLGCEVAPVPVLISSINLWEVSGTYPGEASEVYFEGRDAAIFMVDSLDQIPLARDSASKLGMTWLVYNDKQDIGLHVPGFYMVNADSGRGVKETLERVLFGVYEAPPK
jgi:GTPase SAR1 family protein